jgi:ubiquinol-cytochrome c reductase iron-sulfur subunit
MRHDDYYLCYILPIKSINNYLKNMSDQKTPRRDFIKLATMTLGGVGAASLAIPFITSMNPGKDTLALASTEIDLSPLKEGQSLTIIWRGKPVFVKHRTPQEITDAKNTNLKDLIDVEDDADRVQNDKWLIVLGVCTHLGCVPLGQKTSDTKGDYGGWFCPCHGSHYDTSGRIRKGPAPKNLPVPPYVFLNESRIKIG